MKQEEVRKYWAEKEQRFNEKLINKSVAYYETGHPDYPARAFGLLYLMSESLNFENFEKKTLLPMMNSEYKKIEFRLPLKDIVGYRIIGNNKPVFFKFWKALVGNDSTCLEVDCYYRGRVITLIFKGLLPLEQWEASLSLAIAEKK